MLLTNSKIKIYTKIFRTIAERFLMHPIKMDFKLLLYMDYSKQTHTMRKYG